MPKPLNLFLDPVDVSGNHWSKVHAYGDKVGTKTLRALRLSTTQERFVRAACAGMLSIKPPWSSTLFPVITPLAAGAAIPARVSLYLNMQPMTGQVAFDARAKEILGLEGFLYVDLDGPSLVAGLDALLDAAVVGGSLTRQQVVQELLAGTLAGVFVPGGHAIAKAAVTTAPTREVSINSMCVAGPFDPVMCMDWMRDFVEDGHPRVDELMQLAPWTVTIDGTQPRADAIAFTQQFSYPLPVLEQLRVNFALTATEWRQIGNNQKAIYLRRLRERVGVSTGMAEPPFEFDDPDDKNVFQLEAIAEFYANFPDPWLSGAQPRDPTATVLSGATATAAGGWVQLDGSPDLTSLLANHDQLYLASSDHPSRMYRIIELDAAQHRVRIEGAGRAHIPAAGSAWRITPYQTVDFLDPAGEHATVAGSVVTLDGVSDLTRIWPNAADANAPIYDTLVLDGVTVGTPRVFRIRSVDHATRQVTVSGAPALAGADTAWHIKVRPWLVVVDPLGGRISGESATVVTGTTDTLQLDATVQLDRVNAFFDTIYLPTDTGSPRRAYRIIEVQSAAHRVRVNGAPVLANAGRWHIQAGLSGVPTGFAYDLGPGGNRGFDHFDGELYVVFAGAVQFRMQWNSFTSRSYADYAQFRSTVRGNKQYEYFSFRSARSTGNYNSCNGVQQQPFRNYSLKVVDAGAGQRPGWNELFDGVREARWYFEPATRADTQTPASIPGGAGDAGKTVIRLHHSVSTGGGACSSAGCIVSPLYGRLRSKLASLYDEEHVDLLARHDTEIRKLVGVNDNDDAMRIYEGCDAGGLTGGNYNDKLVGRLWLIRPDERPL